MWLYFALILYIFLLGFASIPRNIYLMLTLGVLTFLSAVRASCIGNDTAEYMSIFSASPNIELNVFEMRYEMGYVLLNKVLYNISSNPQIILIVSSIIIGLGYYKFICKYSIIPMLSVFLFFTFGYWGQMTNIIRQGIAIVIVLFSFDYIKSRKLFKFILIIIIAMLFHRTAIIFLIAYPLSFLKVNLKTGFIAFIISIGGLFFFDFIINKVLLMFPTYSYYLDSAYLDGNVRSATIINIIIVCIILCFGITVNKYTSKNQLVDNPAYKHTNKNTKFNQKDFETISIFLLIGIIVSILSLKFNLLDRVCNYFNVFSIIYLPNIISRIRDRKLIIFISMIITLLFFGYATTIQILRPEWNHIYPYKFFWQV